MKICLIGSSGFIGAVLVEYLIASGHALRFCDIKTGPEGDYRNLTPLHLAGVDVVIHLAGHSSVAACEADPWGSVANNVTDFLPFVEMLAGLEKPPLLLWASSGSVLSDVHSLYDEQKRALEALVPHLYPRSIGLRFASVCGAGTQTGHRNDIILNSMVRAAVVDGSVFMANPNIRKPILGLKDLCRLVESLLIVDEDDLPTLVDLCSFVTTPKGAAFVVNAATTAGVYERSPSQAYDFAMRPHRLATETLRSIVADLVEFYRARVDAEEGHRV